MAPKRRSAGAARPSAPARQQSTLSFQGRKAGVTKPSVKDEKISKKDPELVEEIVRKDLGAESEPDANEPTTAEKAIQRQTERESAALQTTQAPLSTTDAVKTEDILGGRAPVSDVGAIGGKASGWVGDEELKARKVTDSQVKRYWRDKENTRLAPRVHQENLTVYEKVSREWDMSGQYGPCIGIARLKRWKRANLLGLNPPIEVLAVLLKQMDSGDAKVQRAHVDELMSSRFIET